MTYYLFWPRTFRFTKFLVQVGPPAVYCYNKNYFIPKNSQPPPPVQQLRLQFCKYLKTHLFNYSFL